MIWFIHREKRFDRELNLLKTQGDKAQVAVRKAEEIIAKLTEKGWTDLKHVAKLSGHGEHRVDGCIKYDIGGGFRMICFKRGENFYFSYLGTHDDCHRWLNRNRSLHNQVGKREAVTTIVEKDQPTITPISREESGEPDYEDLLMTQINENVLRKVFEGLVRGQQKE